MQRRGLWGYKPATLLSEGVYACTQQLLVEPLNISSQLIHAVMGIRTHDPLISARFIMRNQGYLDVMKFPCLFKKNLYDLSLIHI